MLSLVKLLPSYLRNIFRYADIISVYQSFLYQDVKPQIDAFETRFLIEDANDTDLKNLIFDQGHELYQGQGYTQTSRYLMKELQTLLKRINVKGVPLSYQYIFYIFDLMGDVYPLLYQPDTSLVPFLTFLISDEVDPGGLLLDDGRILDESGYNGLPYWTLDFGAFTSSLTVHFLLSYVSRFIEDTTQFMSTDTANAILNDVKQDKREIEIPHFEFRLYAAAASGGTDTVKIWSTFDGSLSTNQHSVACGVSPNLNNAITVQFGSGARSPINNSITGVQTLIQQLPLSSFLIKMQDSTHLYFKHRLFATTQFFDYREIAILDNGGNCIFYSTFPWIRYPTSSYSSGYFFLTLI